MLWAIFNVACSSRSLKNPLFPNLGVLRINLIWGVSLIFNVGADDLAGERTVCSYIILPILDLSSPVAAVAAKLSML